MVEEKGLKRGLRQVIEKKKLRSHSKYELEQLLNMSRIVEERSEDFS